MGKRKERRLAAKSTAGRRFKLDLFAEPSSGTTYGDLGGSVVQDEVGVDKESKHRADLPNSSSTSGQPENPLLLLGQYSDDELEEDSDKKPDNTSTGETSSPGIKDEAEVSKEGDCLDVNVNGTTVKQHPVDGDTASLNIYQNLEETNTRNNGATSDASKDLCTGQVSDSGAGELNGDVRSSWHMVMHEESNQYYYWNVATGETSWEIPDALAQEAELSGNHKTLAVSERIENTPLVAQDPTTSSVMTLDNPATAINAEGFTPVEWNGGVTNEDQNDVYWSNDNVNSVSAVAPLDQNLTRVDSRVGAIDESGIDLSSGLIKHSESLLDRLKSVIGSKSQQQNLDSISKYILEVEIRLSDIRMLSSFGPSLHHFWAHSERQLKRLEDSINLEIYKLAQSAVIDDEFQVSMELGPKADETGNGGLSPAVDNADIPCSTDSSALNLEDKNDISPANAVPSEEASGDPSPDNIIPTHGSHHVVEDVDMDVDMEVEDASSDDVEEPVQPIQPIQPPQEMHVPPPPPPDEEWVPPPPPDNEQIPPPEPVYIEPFVPYAEQYNLSYPNANFAYYGHAATDVATSNFYGQVEGSQVVVPQAPTYYSSVPSTYAEGSQDVANNTIPVDYYEFQDVVPAAPGINTVESSQFQLEPSLSTYGGLVAGHTRSMDSSVEVSKTSLPTANNCSAIGDEISRATSEILPPTTTIEAPALVSSKENVPLPSTNQASSTSAVTKVPAKVARSKKRPIAVAPTSRSSKKVSSLVNKWKAAKEELLEDEEEPQTAYEMLERKRQKEIEEWHAQQIASGEAKDNANFQPLGGDWRERVKRRRAQLANKTAQTSPEKRNDETQHPDLTELSKDLPSSWQVYWDESSKQVYYGNVVTSETTWTRPTN